MGDFKDIKQPQDFPTSEVKPEAKPVEGKEG